MVRYFAYRCSIFLLLCFISISITAQLSPGDLTDAHAELEGMSNCTQCHTLGDKVSNDKCLACHESLKERVDQNLGFHVSREVRGKDCFTCHSEHHGRKFEMVRFDTLSFDHNLTGYTLEGAHKKVDCASCHKQDNIFDESIREKRKTYLGLTQECLLCHEDFHRNSLSPKCANCHTFQQFEDATKFEHDRTNYKLLGAHESVDCKSCHLPDNDGLTRIFSGIKYGDCDGCHQDVHNNRLGDQCSVCHVETSFASFKGGAGFDHDQTTFPLLGKHKRENCRSCHDLNKPHTTVFMDHEGVDPGACITCHQDVHDGKFGLECKKCHNEDSFAFSNRPESFDHELTGFSLLGKHADVDCKSCHQNSLTEPLPHNTCTSCHEDYHDGQFTVGSDVRDCADCHWENSFSGSTFDFEDHETTDFALTGAHMATPCSACHQKSNGYWQFADLGLNCVDCHDNIHEGQMDNKYFENESCAGCHSTEMWQDISFDHDQTAFQLKGQHKTTECRRCHENEVDQYAFSGISTTCFSCHEEPHRAQFQEDGITDCRKCHSEIEWQPSTFDHDSAAFVLDGAHLGLRCDECHFEIVDELGTFTTYSVAQFECIDCHQ